MATYKKLSPHRRSAAGYSRLWLADDHVLLVTSSGYTEEYRRFFFSDIQALSMQTTNWYPAVNWTFGSLALLFGALGFLANMPSAVSLWTLAAICLVTVIINLLLGPTCSVLIKTAIAAHPLQPLHRVRATRKVIDQLLPLIRDAQGEVTPEQLAAVTAAILEPAVPPIMNSPS